jgi:hypothetical protein
VYSPVTSGTIKQSLRCSAGNFSPGSSSLGFSRALVRASPPETLIWRGYLAISKVFQRIFSEFPEIDPNSTQQTLQNPRQIKGFGAKCAVI